MNDDYRAASRQMWSTAAGGWSDHAEQLEEGPPGVAGAWMVDALDPQPGDRVLELASGAAGVGLRVAEMVTPDGRVVLSDFAEPMVDEIRERLAALDLDNAEARVLDAENLEVGDGEFDAVLCRFGYMLTSDPARALSETFRVLAPGGRLALAVWGKAEDNPWLGLPMKTLLDHLGAPPPPPGTPGPCSLGDRDRLAELLDGAGFEDAAIEQLDSEDRFTDPDSWWDRTLALAAPFTAALSNLPPESAQELEAKVKASAGEFQADDGSLAFPATVLVASARRTDLR